MQKQIIYFDHAATTYVKPEVFDAMKPYFTQEYGNPSSIYSIGRSNKKALEEARASVAKSIGELNRVKYTLLVREASPTTGPLKEQHLPYKKKASI